MLSKAERDELRYGNVIKPDTEARLYETCDELEEEVKRLRNLCLTAAEAPGLFQELIKDSGCELCTLCWRRLKEAGGKEEA